MTDTTFFTSESVSEGHPDKIADQISDAILDALLEKDPNCRVACETLLKNGLVFIAGEIKTSAWVDMEQIARDTIKKIGYISPDLGFDYESCAVLSTIGKQSPDIARGVDNNGQRIGAGDQGMMFGYACQETDVLMPAPITLSHQLMQQQAKKRKSGELDWLRPDAKSQVTLRYEASGKLVIDCVVLSTQHHPDIKQETLEEAVIEEIIKPVLPVKWIDQQTRFLVNPTGRFVVGGPVGDCGLTGRKIIVDTYGGAAHHGGGCFSGKDPSKVDRSAAYLARYIAKNVVAANLAQRCEVQLSYAIGVEEPTSFNLETFGTEQCSLTELKAAVKSLFDLTPHGIIETLDLLRPIYQPTAAYGHFGRKDIEFPWERTDKAEALQQSLQSKNVFI